MIGRWIIKLSLQYRRMMIVSILRILLLTIGIGGFMYLEQLVFFEALWLMIISVMTIGYGDIYPMTKNGQVFTLFIVPAGIVVFSYGFGSAVSYFLEKHFPEKVREKRMIKVMKKLNNHVIICGSGGFAKQVYQQVCISQPHVDIVFISDNRQFLDDNLKPDTLRIIEDPREQKVLEQARAPYAQALFAVMEEDADNVFLTLTAKNLNENIQVAARANREGSEEILSKAGAIHVVNPYVIGGKELAMSILQRSDNSSIQELNGSEPTGFSVEEIKIDTNSPFFQQSLQQLDLHKKFSVFPTGIYRNGLLIHNPILSEELQDHDVLLILGNQEKIEAFKSNH